MFTIPSLLHAYLSCRRNKRRTANALKFETSCEATLLKLLSELQDHSYQPSRSICFVVTYPKVREVFAADFKDRILHHLLVSQLEKYYEKHFIYASFACRKAKGTLAAVTYTRQLILRATHNKTKNAYFGQFDIKSFFTGIDKDILLSTLNKTINTRFPPEQRADLLWLTEVIINNDPTKNYQFRGDTKLFKQIPKHKSLFKAPKNKGLPIGNLTSQFFANVYLDLLDQYCKRELKIKNYVRYVDDIVVIADNLEQIKIWRRQINVFLKKHLKIKLHPGKDKYGSVYAGIDFLGYIIKPDYQLVRKRIVSNLKTKLYYFNHGYLPLSNNQAQLLLPLATPPTMAEIFKMMIIINSYYGHLDHAQSYYLRKNIYKKHFGELGQYLYPLENYNYFNFDIFSISEANK